MKKNSQIHLLLETDLLDNLKRQAEDENTSVSELIRQRLEEPKSLERIEVMIGEIHRKVVGKIQQKRLNTLKFDQYEPQKEEEF